MRSIALSIALIFKTAAKSVVYVKKDSRVQRAILALPDWVTPNAVTGFRAIMVIPFAFDVSFGCYWAALFGLVVMGLLDALDGMIAEAKGPKTVSGAFFDPLADKLTTWAAIYFLLPELPFFFTCVFWLIFAFGLGNMLGRVIKLGLKKPWFIACLRRLALIPKQTIGSAGIMAVTASKVKFHLESYGAAMLLLGFALSSIGLTWAAGTLLAVSLFFALFSFRAQIPALSLLSSGI